VWDFESKEAALTAAAKAKTMLLTVDMAKFAIILGIEQG
jgi:hypothetical protein